MASDDKGDARKPGPDLGVRLSGPVGLRAGAFEELGLPYRPDVSRTALGKYPREYRRTYRGREITLGPHLAFGAQTPRTCLRIYFWINEQERTFVVGHVGLHLKDTTN